MKLTNFHRQAFVASVMNDVPKIEHQEQLQALILDDMIKSAPAEVAALLKEEKLRHYVLGGYNLFYPANSGYSYGIGSVMVYRGYEPTPAALKKVAVIVTAAVAQHSARSKLQSMIEGVIASCSTVKAAAERLPEFVKYLPIEPEKGTMLPAIANLASELMKMGWPKDAAPAAAAA